MASNPSSEKLWIRYDKIRYVKGCSTVWGEERKVFLNGVGWGAGNSELFYCNRFHMISGMGGGWGCRISNYFLFPPPPPPETVVDYQIMPWFQVFTDLVLKLLTRWPSKREGKVQVYPRNPLLRTIPSGSSIDRWYPSFLGYIRECTCACMSLDIYTKSLNG